MLLSVTMKPLTCLTALHTSVFDLMQQLQSSAKCYCVFIPVRANHGVIMLHIHNQSPLLEITVQTEAKYGSQNDCSEGSHGYN